MKAAVLTDERTVANEENEKPTLDDEGVLVQVNACGVCMTDYHTPHGTFPVEFPIIPGHESAGKSSLSATEWPSIPRYPATSVMRA